MRARDDMVLGCRCARRQGWPPLLSSTVLSPGVGMVGVLTLPLVYSGEKEVGTTEVLRGRGVVCLYARSVPYFCACWRTYSCPLASGFLATVLVFLLPGEREFCAAGPRSTAPPGLSGVLRLLPSALLAFMGDSGPYFSSEALISALRCSASVRHDAP